MEYQSYQSGIQADLRVALKRLIDKKTNLPGEISVQAFNDCDAAVHFGLLTGALWDITLTRTLAERLDLEHLVEDINSYEDPDDWEDVVILHAFSLSKRDITFVTDIDWSNCLRYGWNPEDWDDCDPFLRIELNYGERWQQYMERVKDGFWSFLTGMAADAIVSHAQETSRTEASAPSVRTTPYVPTAEDLLIREQRRAKRDAEELAYYQREERLRYRREH